MILSCDVGDRNLAFVLADVQTPGLASIALWQVVDIRTCLSVYEINQALHSVLSPHLHRIKRAVIEKQPIRCRRLLRIGAAVECFVATHCALTPRIVYQDAKSRCALLTNHMHAKIPAGKKGYKDRKNLSISLCERCIKESAFEAAFRKVSKKDDLADCFVQLLTDLGTIPKRFICHPLEK